MAIKVRQAIELLKSNGWTLDRTKGDHRVFVKPGHRPIVVPGKLSDDLPIGTWMSIKRAAGL